MIGIRPTSNAAHWDLELCDRMYYEILQPCTNMAILPIQYCNGPRSDLDIRSYDCILVDEDDADQKSTLNDSLVSSGLADYESLDRHHLTVNREPAVNTRMLNSDDDSDQPECWDNERYENPQFSKTQNSDENGVINFDYNFTDGEIMHVMRSLVSYAQSNITKLNKLFFPYS